MDRVIKKKNCVSFSHVPHGILHNCLKLTVHSSLLCSFLLLPFEHSPRLVLLFYASWPLFTLLTFAPERISIFHTFDSNYLETLPNWHYLTNQSSPHKQVLTVLRFFLVMNQVFLNNKKLSLFGHSVWKYSVGRAVMLGFNSTMSCKKWQKCLCEEIVQWYGWTKVQPVVH